MKILFGSCALTPLLLAFVALSSGYAFAKEWKEPKEYKAVLYSLVGCKNHESYADLERSVNNVKFEVQENGIKVINTKDKKWCGVKFVHNTWLANATYELNVVLTDVDLWDEITKFYKIEKYKR